MEDIDTAYFSDRYYAKSYRRLAACGVIFFLLGSYY